MKSIPFSQLFKLQFTYFLIGLGYNGVSYFMVINGGQQLSSNPPVSSAMFMLLYLGFIMTGKLGFIKAYRGLMIFALIAFGYGGIVKHLILYPTQPDLYATFLAFVIGAGINVFGFVLNIYGALNRVEWEK